MDHSWTCSPTPSVTWEAGCCLCVTAGLPMATTHQARSGAHSLTVAPHSPPCKGEAPRHAPHVPSDRYITTPATLAHPQPLSSVLPRSFQSVSSSQHLAVACPESRCPPLPLLSFPPCLPAPHRQSHTTQSQASTCCCASSHRAVVIMTSRRRHMKLLSASTEYSWCPRVVHSTLDHSLNSNWSTQQPVMRVSTRPSNQHT